MTKVRPSKSIPFHRVDFSDAEIHAVSETMASGWVNTGPRVKEFENALLHETQSSCVIAVSSAWAGLFLALKAFGIGHGDEVITTPFTFATTANVIEQLGACPVFVDIDLGSHTLAIEKVHLALTKNTKAIIPVDLGGAPADYTALQEVLQRVYTRPKDQSPAAITFQGTHVLQKALGRPLILVDAAHAFGSTRNISAKKDAPMGDIRVYSFHTVKNITTVDGGAIAIYTKSLLAESFQLERHLRAFTLHGMDRDAHTRYKMGSISYDIINAGFKTNLTDIAASIGLVQLSRWKDIAQKRKKIRNTYDDHFNDQPYYRLRPKVNYFNDWNIAWHLYSLEIAYVHGQDIKTIPVAERLALRVALIRDFASLNGISGFIANVHYTALYRMTHYKHYFNTRTITQKYPNTELISTTTISLPFHSKLSDDELERIIDRVLTVAKQRLA